MKKLLSILILFSLSLSAQVSKDRLKTSGYGWANRVVPVNDKLDSTFSSFWMPTGNAVNSNTAFIGTTNNKSLYVKTNNQQRIKVDSLGAVSITPDQTNFAIPLTITTNSNGNSYVIQQGPNNSALLLNNTTTNKSWYLSNSTTGLTDIFSIARSGNPNNAPLMVDQNDRVHVGNTTGAALGSASLNVKGTMSVSSTATLNGGISNNSITVVGNTGTTVIGGLGGGYASLHLGIPTNSLSATNFFLAGDGLTGAFVNAPLDSSNLYLTKGNGSYFALFQGNKTNSAAPGVEFRVSDRPNITAGNACLGYWFNSQGTKKWKTGSIGTDYQFYISSPLYQAIGASTITNAFMQWNEIPNASTNMSITNKWGFGTNGSAQITQSVLIGATARTPSANLDVSGTMSVSSTSTLGNIRINTGASTGKIQSSEYTANSGALYFNQTTLDGSTYAISGIDGANTLINAKTVTNFRINGSDRVQLTSSSLASVNNTVTIGYAAGSGSTVTQGTSRSTGVTINSVTGAITLFTAAGTTAYTSFIVTNSNISATDIPVVSIKSGTNKYLANVTAVNAGSFEITFNTTGGTASDTPIINFAIIKGSSN